MSPITTDLALLRLLQFTSPGLPVGAYAFSQGLEAALELQWVSDSSTLQDWLSLQLHQGLARVDLPLLLRLYEALDHNDAQALRYWNHLLPACRESAELRLGELATGAALARLLPQLGLQIPQALQPPTFAGLFALTARHWQIPARTSAIGYAWTWLENQVVAATKLLPLGQTQAQQLLSALQVEIPAALTLAETLGNDELGSSLSGLAFASMHHETQYTRLFRS